MLDSLNRGIYYLAGALVLALIALMLPWPLMLIMLWVTAGLAWFGVAYWTGRGGLLFKDSEGRLPVAIKALLFPVLLGVTLYNVYARSRSGQPPMQKIRNGVWLGRRLLPTDQDLLRENHITAILDVTAEFDTLPRDLLPNDVHYLNVPVMDHEPLKLAQLKRAVAWTHKHRRAGRQVLIHCALGKGRSAMALLAYLKAVNPDRSYADLLEEVQAIRPIVRPNARQMKLLHQFAEQSDPLHKPRTCLIFNPASGKDGLSIDEKISAITDLVGPFFDVTVYETTPDKTGGPRTEEAIKAGFEQILVFGGDGTVGEVASKLMGTNVPLGIIPGGTANSLAVCLYGATNHVDPVRHACFKILQGQVIQIDAARTNHGDFFLLAGIGLEAGMVEKADRGKKDATGVFAYLLGGLESVSEQSAFQVTLEIEGETHDYHTGSVVVANASPSTSVFANGLEESDFADGLLEVTVIPATEDGNTLSMDAITDLIWSHEHSDDCAVTRHKAKNIKITADPPQRIVIDGEMRGKTPLKIECLPGALKVFCPVEGAEI